jgi:hypothetical protein
MADADFRNRVLLMDFNGTDEDTSFTEQSPAARTVTFAGSAKLEATGAISGATSLYLDGVDSYVSIPTDSWDLIPSAANFCIEFDYKSIAASAPGATVVFASMWDTGSNQRSWTLWYSPGTNILTFSLSSGGVVASFNAAVNLTTEGVDLFDGSTHHIAIYGTAGGVYVAVDGNVGTSPATGIDYTCFYNTASPQPIRLGCQFVFGAADSLIEGMFDNFRFTNGKSPYTATTGTFTPDTRPFDIADAGDDLAYSYPAQVPFLNMDAEDFGHYPWVPFESLYGGEANSPNSPGESIASGSAHGGSNVFNFTMSNGNATLGVNAQIFDLTRLNNDEFLNDIDAGTVLCDLSGWAYLITDANGGFGRYSVFFKDVSDNILATFHSDSVQPALTTWTEVAKDDVPVPPDTRKIEFVWGGRKASSFHTSSYFFWDDFTVTLKQRGDSNVHNVTKLADVAEIVSTWVSVGTLTQAEEPNTAQNVAWFPYVYDTTAISGAYDAYSPLYDLKADTSDIDAGSATYAMESMMQGASDTCYMWCQFFEADGVTTVGSRVSSTAKTHSGQGEIVTLTGTIPANARKVQLGFNTANGASGSRFDAKDVVFYEEASAVDGAVAPSGLGSAIATIIFQ